MQFTSNWLKGIFSVDRRSLGLFRIFIGFFVALDSLNKFFQAREFYSDWGVMPRAYWIEHYMVPFKFSMHLGMGDTWFQQLLIFAQLLAALAFMVGWKTRRANAILLFFLCSMQSRNNLILSASDEVMRLMLIWSLFAPVGDRFSLSPLPKEPNNTVSAGAAAMLLQLVSIYLFTGFLKLHPVWTEQFSAVYFALNIDIFATPLAIWFRQFYLLTQILTATTLAWEFLGPILAIFSTGWLRLACSVLFMMFHFSLIFFLELGMFPYMMITTWLIFWPPVFWESKAGANLEARLEGLFRFLANKLRLPSAPRRRASSTRLRLASQVFVMALFTLVTLNNVSSLKTRYFKMPAALASVVHLLYVDQEWNMFAPYPIKNDGWFVIEGNFRNGKKWDLWNGGAISYEKPALVSAAFHSSEWRKFMLQVWDDGDRRILLPFGRYLCRKFSAAEGQSSDVSTLKIQFVKETTPEPGTAFGSPEIITLWSHDCFAP